MYGPAVSHQTGSQLLKFAAGEIPATGRTKFSTQTLYADYAPHLSHVCYIFSHSRPDTMHDRGNEV